MGRIALYGLPIAIEQPRGTYRTGIDPKTGKRWVSRMAAHYGYFSNTKGKDGDGVDVFVGFYPQSEQAYVVNQFIGGGFDEHKVLLAYPDEQSAKRAYLDSYERGWNGLESIIPLSTSQLKWWLKNGDMSRPLRLKNIPPEGFENMNKVYWNSDALPYDHTLDGLLYDIRRSENGDLLMDAVSIQDIIEDSDGILALDALVTPYARLERKMEILRGIMERVSTTVKPVALQITEPFKQRGVANVAAVFELSDGQTVSVFLHNPDVTPNKMAPMDELVSFAWRLNKRDITIVVAPERGEDLNVREVAKRIMKLAERNSAAFARANAKRSERMQNIENLKTEIVGLEKELADAQHELEIVKVEAENRKPTAQPEPQPQPEPENTEEKIDPATPEDYTKIMADPELRSKYEDDLDSFLHGRTLAVRNALRNLGWNDNGDKSGTVLSKSTGNTFFQFTFDYKYASGNANVIGITAVIKSITGLDENKVINPETRIDDDLTKTPEQFAAGIDAASAKDVRVSHEDGDEDAHIELTGKELGEFPDTEEGKISLRSAAIEFFDKELIAKGGVRNIALDKLVEFNAKARNKVESFSADPRKLHLVRALRQIVATGKPTETSPINPHVKAEREGVKLVHVLKTPVKLNGENIKVRFLVYEKKDGHLFYDHAVDNSEIGTVMGGSTEALDSTVAADLNLSALLSSEPSPEHHRIDSIRDDLESFKGVSLDSAGGKMVFNLFIEGEEPEVIEDDEEDRIIDPDSDLATVLQDIVDGKYDDTDLNKLLDMIDEAANAIINAGLGEQYDQLVGQAAEKWASLDLKANG